MRTILLLIVVFLTPSALYAENYDRSDWGGWRDFDSDCQDTRQEELIEHAISFQLSKNGCTVVSGKWFDPYTEQYFYEPSRLDVDHIVPLEWAYRHGAKGWPKSLKVKFANDPENLIPVSASANRSKGSKGYLQWLPPVSSETAKCAYILHFDYIMSKYSLTFSESEQPKAEKIVSRCR